MQCFDQQSQLATLSCIPIVFGNIIGFLMALSSVMAVYFIIFAAIKYLTSGGEMEKVASAKKSLTYAVIGFGIILLSFLILKAISTLTGTDCKILGVGC